MTVAQSRGGIEILVDFYCFDHYVIEKLSDSLNKVSKNTRIHVQGGEYRTVDEFVRKLYTDLQAVGITLVTVKDGAKGRTHSVMLFLSFGNFIVKDVCVLGNHRQPRGKDTPGYWDLIFYDKYLRRYEKFNEKSYLKILQKRSILFHFKCQ